MSRVGIHAKGELSIESLLDFIRANERFKEVGGVASFFGFVKGFTDKNEEVTSLELEAYKERAEETFRKISEDIRNRPGVVDCLIHHVTGKLSLGDLIFVVMVAGRSRKDVFPALVEAVERAKREAAIWKKESLSTGESYWVEYGQE
ncbi:MAG: molybdenum cofactor biosynthesis protein MoaE [Candidatus Bathyarchaeia archaeon]